MLVVPFVLLAAAIAILSGVVVTAMGRGGELTIFHRDLPAEHFQLRSVADVANLRLPAGFFGYQEQATSAALRDIVGLLASQEAEIARLREEVWRLSAPVSTGPASVSTSSVPVGAGPVALSAGQVTLSASAASVDPEGAVDRDEAPDQQIPPL